MWLTCLMSVAGLLSAADSSGSIITNAGFESWTAVKPGPDGLLSGWRLDTPPQLADSWTLNTAYPGQLLVGQRGPHSGQRFARIVASAEQTPHLYQMCKGLKAGAWYRVSAWTRGGPVACYCYEYGKSKFLGTVTVAQTTGTSDGWRLVSGYYRPPTDEYERSALAVSVPPGQTADVDDITVAAVQLADVPASAADVMWETDTLRLTVSPSGMLREFRAKPAGQDYSAGRTPFGILSVVRNGVSTPLHHLARQGDLLLAQFLDPEVKATLRVTPRKRHLLFEVVSVQPADVEQLTWTFPIRRLATVGSAFNATYDDTFGACLFGTTVNAFNGAGWHGRDVFSMGGGCTRKHGLAGAKFALVAAPADQFKPAIMETEKANGLPCPMLGGRWARDSEAVRRSYLFMVDAAEANIDRTIEYAKLGGFGMIIFLKDNWLSTHGHFQINRRNFPDGLASLKRAVDKIHAAGLGAGVHVFGPSISPNDPYVTPKPDDRLAAIACPPLAEAVDDKARTLTLAGEADVPPKKPRSAAFPGYYLRVGDEIVRYQEVEPGPPFRFTGCQRGTLGTKAAAHPAGTTVRGLLNLWGYFVVDPDSTLADEVVRNFGQVFNACDFDMVYFDASDGIHDAYGDRWYYLNKMHLGYYRQFRKDVLYQTSNGTGTDICWHLIPRSASADGHGDLKGYLDERWPGILGTADNWTRPDVGWYYIFTEVRPDQIEYVCAKVLGIDGSISIETSQSALEKHVYGRRMMDTLGRYEQCRLAGDFAESVRALLREPGKDFRVFGGPGNWNLCRAVYEQPRVVESLDGQQNVWTIRNDQPQPCSLAVEITCGTRNLPTADYDHPKSVTCETFDDAQPYRLEQTPTPQLREARGVRQTFEISSERPKIGPRSAVWSVKNSGDHGGWASVGRRFATPVNLGGSNALALWVHGDGGGEQLRIQLSDSAGRAATWLVPIGFHGWRLCTYGVADAPKLDWSKIAALQFWVQSLRVGMSAQVGLDDLRALPEVHTAGPLVAPTIEVNGRRLPLAKILTSGQGLSADNFEGVQMWTGGMQPGQRLEGDPAKFVLQPGENRITFTADAAVAYPGDVTVIVSRLWHLKPRDESTR
jgi:hypothetical protein